MRLACLMVVLFLAGCGPSAEVRVGSKAQPESIILGEMATLLARSAGTTAEHRPALGGTQIVWHALLKGNINVYVDYTGTISEEILAGRGLKDEEALRRGLAEYGISMSRPLGFNDSYAIGMKKEAADRLGLRKMSDLRNHPELRFGFSSEFMDRKDGWPGLRDRYGLPQKNVIGLNHDLAYQGLVNGALDATDLYSTDAEIRSHKLQVLADDLGFFPPYQAVLLYRSELEERLPAAVAALLKLEGKITETDMVDMNARAKLDKTPESLVAADFLTNTLKIRAAAHVDTMAEYVWRLTREHLFLVFISLVAAIVIAVPLGIVAARRPVFGQGILAVAGTLQTIPSMALLAFLIPLLDIGPKPAIAALFLYSLLPIVQNTYAGLHNIPEQIRESAEALGLPLLARLRLVELPLAARTIMAGIKIAAVINIGTATLGGFVGAGGYGEAIFRGIPKRDTSLILQGAIPAVIMALLAQGVFGLAERWLVPAGLRLKAE